MLLNMSTIRSFRSQVSFLHCCFSSHAGVLKTASILQQTTMGPAVSEDNVHNAKPYIFTYSAACLVTLLFFLLDDRGMLELRKTADYGRSFQTIATRVYSFVLGGRFVFASIMTGKVCVCVQISTHP